ncbi:MAG TPA: hypothetical protein VLC98_10955 [Phnomibacter sp.]|nr:hypothetical protein [Phnomibacter sp.]
MKKLNTLIAAALFVATSLQTTAQNLETKPWHVRRAYGSANAGTGHAFSLNIHFENQWVAFTSYSAESMKAKDLPADFKNGYTMVLFFGAENPTPKDEFHSFNLGMGKVFTKPSDKFWIMGTAAINIGEYKKATFTRNTNQTDPSIINVLLLAYAEEDNYNHTYNKSMSIGTTLGLQTNVTLCRYIGLGAGAHVQLTTAGVIPGAWLGLNVGLLRPKKVHADKL